MIIASDFQLNGIGREILNRLVDRARSRGITDIQLFCAKDKEGFYLKNGFMKRPSDAPGMEWNSSSNLSVK